MPRKTEPCTICSKPVERAKTATKPPKCWPCTRIKRCGTSASYSAGCRCQPCKDSQAKRQREYAAKRKAEGRPLPRSEWRAYEDVTCDCCGSTYQREKRTSPRYTRSFCSSLCRDFTLYGPRSKPLPANHISFWVGQTCEWKPKAQQEEREFTCNWCDKQSTTIYPTAQYCGGPCKVRAGRARRRAAEFNAPGTYTWGQLVMLWEQFGKCCAYCRTPTPLPEVQAEHVIALARGGANNIGNMLPSCGPCNSDKRDLTMSEWRTEREQRHLPPVVTAWDHKDPRYAHLTV